MSTLNLAGATVLVTGAASGIGAATTRALIEAGANVAWSTSAKKPLA